MEPKIRKEEFIPVPQLLFYYIKCLNAKYESGIVYWWESLYDVTCENTID